MNYLKSKIWLSAIFALSALLVIQSCKKDPVIPMPTPGFTFTTDGKTATFTNTSKDADSYSWDFGDGNTSTVDAPSHTYTSNGSYVVTLTATNTSGSKDYQGVVEIINITIDGDFSDWANTPDVSVPAGGTVTKMKLENLENNKLYIYLEGTADLTDLTQVYLNTDNDKTTGALIDWLWFEGGEDILIEGNIPASLDQYGSIYKCSPCDGSNPGNWNWEDPASNDVISSFIVSSEMITTANGKAFEFVIDLTALGVPINATQIGVGVADVSLATWGPVGSSPALWDEIDNPTGTLFTYVFN